MENFVSNAVNYEISQELFIMILDKIINSNKRIEVKQKDGIPSIFIYGEKEEDTIQFFLNDFPLNLVNVLKKIIRII